MTTKAEVQAQLKEVQAQLAKEQARPIGHTISNTTIDMAKTEDSKLAIANAVAEGMKALQAIGEGSSYGIYLEGK